MRWRLGAKAANERGLRPPLLAVLESDRPPRKGLWKVVLLPDQRPYSLAAHLPSDPLPGIICHSIPREHDACDSVKGSCMVRTQTVHSSKVVWQSSSVPPSRSPLGGMARMDRS